MIVLDTNVVSETMRVRPDDAVLAWFRANSKEAYLTATTVGEIFTGLRLLPQGKRRLGLGEVVEQTLARFAGRVLVFDEPAARVYADLRVARRSTGAPISVEDAMIAAVCRRHGAKLATRNTKDFEGLGVDLIDPWQT